MPTLERLVPADADSLAALGELASTASRPTSTAATPDEQLTVAVPHPAARGWLSAPRDLLAGLPASLPLLRSPSTVPAVAAVRALPRRTQLLALAAASVAAGLLAGLVVPVASAAPAPTASATVPRSSAAANGSTPGSHAAGSTRTRTVAAARPATASSRPGRSGVAATASRPAQAPAPATRPVSALALGVALPALASATSIDWTPAARSTVTSRPGRPGSSVAPAAATRENAPSRPSPQTVAAARAYKPTVRLPAASGAGRRIVYSQHRGHLWIVAGDGRVVRDYPVTGRIGRPAPGTYRVFSKSRTAVNPAAKVRFDLMVRFAHGITGAPIGFHTIPRWYDGRPLQKVSQLGQMIGAGGCVRQSLANARWLYRWVAVGERVVVLR